MTFIDLKKTIAHLLASVLKQKAGTMLKISKFIDKKHETTFSVPDFVMGLVSALLPRSARCSLADRGIDLDEILMAIRNKAPYRLSLTVREHGINKQVVISLV
jgi:hypothetical protein